MYPLSLRMENFCCYNDSTINFDDFSAAVIVGKIRGSDKYSNGSGKSTIFAAIKFALFGEVDFSTMEKVIRHDADFAKVSFDFRSSLDGNTYRVEREKRRKPTSDIKLLKLENDEWKAVTGRRGGDTQKEIQKIIKVNYDTFCNSVLFSQGDLTGLASLFPKDRKLILKEALQLGVYSKYEKLAKKKAGDILKEIEKNRTILGTFGQPEEDIAAISKELESNIGISGKLKLSVEEQRAKLQAEQSKYVECSKKIELLKAQVAHTIETKKKLETDTAKLLVSLEENSAKVNRLKKTNQEIENTIKSYKPDTTKLRAESVVEEELSTITNIGIEKKASLKSLEDKLEELSIPLPEEGVCKHCRRPITNEDRKACQESIDHDITKTNRQIATLNIELSELRNKRDSLLVELETITAQKNKNERTSKLIEIKGKEYENNVKLLSEYLSIMTSFEESWASNKRELALLNNSIPKDLDIIIQGYNTELNASLERGVSLQEELDKIEAEIKQLDGRKEVLNFQLEQKKKDIGKIKKFKEALVELESKYLLHQKAVQAFSPSGIPALITHTILDDFQVEANLLLSQLRPGLQLQFSVIKDRDDGEQEDTLDISYLLNGVELEYKQLSGAQKLLVCLALKLGLASVLKRKLGTEIKMLLIDELDQALDDGAIETFEDAIKKLQKDYKILIITHNKDLKMKFNKAILVEQDERLVSSAKVVDQWL